MNLTLPVAALCDPEERPRLTHPRAGRGGLAQHQLTGRFVLQRVPRIPGMAIAIVLSIILGMPPKLYGTPITQSSLAGDDTAQTEDLRDGIGLPLNPWVAALGVPALSQFIQKAPDGGLNVAQTSAPGRVTVSLPDPVGYQQTYSHRETLEQILRSIATVRPQSEVRVLQPDERPLSAAGSQSINNDSQDRGFYELFLQSETAGDALSAVVNLRTVDEHGVTFSILGVGNFGLDTIAGTHDVMLSDLSNGWSIAFSRFAYPNRVEYTTNPAQSPTSDMSPPKAHLLRLVVAWVLDFMASPIGILLAIVSGLALLVWVATSLLTVVRGTPSRHRRLKRRGLQHAGVTTGPRHKTRVAFSRRHSRSGRRFGKRAPQA